MAKWYAVMRNHDDDDWGTGSSGLVDAEKMVIENLDVYPDGYIAVIDDGDCVDEIEQDDFDPVYCYAARIVKANDWEAAMDDLNHLMYWLDMEDEWKQADGDNFLDVIRKAGQKIGVSLV